MRAASQALLTDIVCEVDSWSLSDGAYGPVSFQSELQNSWGPREQQRQPRPSYLHSAE